MRLLTSLLLLATLAAMASAQQGGGFFSGLTNFFRPRRQQPPPGRPVQPVQQPQQQDANSQFRQGPSSQSVPASNAGPAPACANAAPNHQWNGKQFLLSFLVDKEGCTQFTGEQADAYCRANGGVTVSLDNDAKAEHFISIAAQHAQRFYWTGGKLDHSRGVLTWPSGATEQWVRGSKFWSPIGGGKDKGPQPDNRSQLELNEEPEICLAVLNNFYADGIKFHDVACHHKKPTICEFP